MQQTSTLVISVCDLNSSILQPVSFLVSFFYRLIMWLIIIINCSIIPIHDDSQVMVVYFVALAHALWDKYYYYCYYMGNIILQARGQIVNNNVLGR